MDQNLKLLISISALYTRVSKAVEKKLSIHGVSFSEFLVMHQLAQTHLKIMRRIDLAEAIGLSASGVTRLLNPMEKLNIVKKEASARDARVSFVKLTDTGENLYIDVLQSVKETTDLLFESLQTDQIKNFLNIISTIKG